MKPKLPFTNWERWFSDFAGRQLPLPKPSEPEMSPEERRLIGPSVRQFQLGESSDARNLLRKAGKYAARTGDISYPLALRAFTREENRHASMLGRFMDREGIDRISKSRSDSLFRRIRHNLNLRRSLIVLLTAEFIAVPYYTALRRATSSTLLATICEQILLDEARHICFQSKAIHILSQPLSRRSRRLDNLFARCCMEAAMDVVWFTHGRVLQAGGYDYHDYRQSCLEQFHYSRAMVDGTLPIPEPDPPLPQSSRTDDLPNRPVSRRMFARNAGEPQSSNPTSTFQPQNQ